MADLAIKEFSSFFNKLWGYPPFAWQQKLAERVLYNEECPWPQAIALPTAAGKTACIDIAVFALAAQAQRMLQGDTVTAPRRIFFVVDRRIIVDEAFERARKLASALNSADVGILKAVADALRFLARGEPEGAEDEPPLTVHTLRGGMYRSESWARNPLQPTVVASTIDQLGSRLLFRPYGRSANMAPIYAGLIANDSLILLDEAHCAQPFMQSLQAIDHYRAWAEQPLNRSFYPVVMSATPPSGLNIFKDESSEPEDPDHPLGRRQLACKPTTLNLVTKAKGKNATQVLAKELAKTAEKLINERRRAVVIFVNRVATARAVHNQLADKYGDDVTLLTGRMRGVDKEKTAKDKLTILSSANSTTRRLDGPRFVVATQTLEVGADLDFDALVTECASLDALRQRFGRLNRMGRDIEACAALLIRGDQVNKNHEDPIYGPALANTWAWLNEQVGEGKTVDFGIKYINALLPQDRDLFASLSAPARDAAIMLPAHIDCWAQTAPQPAPSPDVAPFLRGPSSGTADVQVCLRVRLNLDSIKLCPPTSGETLPVPIGVFKHWLTGSLISDASSDVEGADSEPDLKQEKRPIGNTIGNVLRWRGKETQLSDFTSDPTTIRPGDVVVVSANAPNLTVLGDIPAVEESNTAALDIGDQAYLITRAKPVLRLQRDLLSCWPKGLAREQALSLLTPDHDNSEELNPEELLTAVRKVLQTLVQETAGIQKFDWLNKAAYHLNQESKRRGFSRNLHQIDEGHLIVIGQNLVPEFLHQADTFSGDDDVNASGMSNKQGQPIKLRDHLPGVESFARRFARGCGLSSEIAGGIARAGLLHDLGKADRRFQSLLQGGNRFLAATEPLAKSAAIPKDRQAFERAREASGYPAGGRHELLSVRLAQSAPSLLPKEPWLQDLILHLIASHHGHCRPFAPVVLDDDAPTTTLTLHEQSMTWTGATKLENLNSGVAQRYWRLVRRFGWWGLAWLESLLRLADHRRSEWEQMQ